MQLAAYLQRIGYTGPLTPSLEVLHAIHRCHALRIPYENLDVIQQQPVDQNLERIFDKIVTQKRGGWCYEMNGLLGWALQEIGFDVQRLCGGVMRVRDGDTAWGNHLVLAVQIAGKRWMADVGLGDAILEPIPFEAGEHGQYGRQFRLETLDGEDGWRLHNRTGAVPPTVDILNRSDEHRLKQIELELQSNAESIFRQNLICQQMRENDVDLLLGRVLSQEYGARKTLLNDAGELQQVLADLFGLQVSVSRALWQQISVRHEQLFGDIAAQDIQLGLPD